MMLVLVLVAFASLCVIVPIKLVDAHFDAREHERKADLLCRLAQCHEPYSQEWHADINRARYHAHMAGFHDGHDCKCDVELKP